MRTVARGGAEMGGSNKKSISRRVSHTGFIKAMKKHVNRGPKWTDQRGNLANGKSNSREKTKKGAKMIRFALN